MGHMKPNGYDKRAKSGYLTAEDKRWLRWYKSLKREKLISKINDALMRYDEEHLLAIYYGCKDVNK